MTSWPNRGGVHLLSVAIRLAVLLVFAAVLRDARAHVPLPESVLNPQTAPEAWNILRLATANIDRLLRENRLAEVPDQASLCSPALRTLAHLEELSARRPEFAARIVRASAAVNSLAQACVSGNAADAGAALEKLRSALRILAEGEDPNVVNADLFFCPMHPDVLSTDAAVLCPKCGMALVPRRIPYSFVYVPPGEPSIKITAQADAPLEAGKEARVRVRLTKGDSSPVLLTELMVAHTQPIHLLIIDPSLEDYHHEHPVPTGTPGEYTFTFTPAKSGDYRVIADLVPAATGVQEYTATTLPGQISAPVNERLPADRANTFTAKAGGLIFQLTASTPPTAPLRAGQTQALQVGVSDADGKPVRRLEVVMNAFAHLVGFYDDGRTVVHLHPAGGEIVDPGARGGPMLEFRFYPPKTGFLRLYCQVQVDGRMIFAPFSVNIAP